MSTGAEPAERPALVVPVKTLSRAKTRLDGHPREALMRAFALDALGAAVASRTTSGVYVVSGEPGLVADARALGCEALPDHGDGDLNEALRRAVDLLPAGPVAVMLGDLPALLTADLDAALTWRTGRTVVADSQGTGTTLLLTPAGAAFTPAFGAGSYAAHVAAGHRPVPLDVASLRRDVDTAADLAAAVALGVGPRTAAVLG